MKRVLKKGRRKPVGDGIRWQYRQRSCINPAQYFWKGLHLCAYHTPIGYRQYKHRIDIPLEKQR